LGAGIFFLIAQASELLREFLVQGIEIKQGNDKIEEIPNHKDEHNKNKIRVHKKAFFVVEFVDIDKAEKA
jgi:hypothetical protein